MTLQLIDPDAEKRYVIEEGEEPYAYLLYKEALPEDLDAIEQQNLIVSRKKKGATLTLSTAKQKKEIIEKYVYGWGGFVDVNGKEIPFDKSLLCQLPAHARDGAYLRIRGITVDSEEDDSASDPM